MYSTIIYVVLTTKTTKDIIGDLVSSLAIEGIIDETTLNNEGVLIPNELCQFTTT